MALSPYDQGMLVVGAKAGLVEILRTDTLLTRLQRFSVLHSITGSLCSSLGTVSVSADVDLYTNSATTSRTDPHCLLTLRFAPVPNWMAGSTPLIAPGCNQEARVCGGWPAMSTMNAAQPATKSDTDLRSEVPDSSIGIEQFKRYSGWQLSDVIHVKLHKLSKTL
ncbi:unnamed protein product [Protopolystoma xenopodis]|uniref:Uncharacterized protein n=1 Tax=Protopolystoma xenopodis TaxID=117903 RepID=A0A448X5P6_9PLAT|nr:unnamed protein product [Protopolystoma xenopodis]